MQGWGLHGRPLLMDGFFARPLKNTLPRVGAGAARMRGWGLHGRPPSSYRRGEGGRDAAGWALVVARPDYDPRPWCTATSYRRGTLSGGQVKRGEDVWGGPLWSPVRYPTRVSLFEMYWPSSSPCSSSLPCSPMDDPLGSPDNVPASAVHSRGDPSWSPCSSSSPCYPPPKPLPHTRTFWLATTLVTLLTLLFSTYFIFYLTGRQDAYLTNAEDLGIMDQAIWNTLHGHLLHQTICNIVSDTNCYSLQGITRFAIHFEPILLPISLLYLIWPTPKTLLVLQTLVVASGAFPAFWLARLRLRNEWAGIAISLLYLLYPAQQNALIFDFHAVTLTSALLLFTLYFMYTRRTALLFVFAILAMACKEEIPLVVALLGLWSMLLQRRWRSGLLLLLLATAWTGLALLVIHLSSPTGHSLLATRYAYLGNTPPQIAHTLLVHPLAILKQHLLDRAHRTYLASLLTPAGYLPLLAPWILILALPTLALNLLSSNPGMYSGLFQYNAEITPILIHSTIESIALILWLVQAFSKAAFLETWPLSRRGGGGADAGRGPLWPPAPATGTRPASFLKTSPPALGTGTRPASFLGTRPPSRRGGGGADVGRGPLWPPAPGASKHNEHPQESPPNLTQLPPLHKPSPLSKDLTKTIPSPGYLHTLLLALLLIYILFTVVHQNYTNSSMPFARDFRWPHTTAHTHLAQRFIDLIPPTASVSAQTRLVPHLSQRLNVYMFPYADDRADYILLDVTGDKYPYFNAQAYTREVKKVLHSGNYGILAAENGYLLLERGLPTPGVLPYSLF